MDIMNDSPQPDKIRKVSLIAPIILSIISILGLVLLTYMYFHLEKQITQYQNIIDEQKKQLKDIQTDISRQKNINDITLSSIVFLSLENRVSERIVTDDLVIHKAVFVDTTERLKGVIDVYTQPRMSYSYEGAGKFNISDRELRSMLISMMEQLESYYKDNIENEYTYMPKWDTAEFVLTIKNYELGTYKNGKVILKGEN